ncbi:hypothetical protein E2C01_083955 [Portunus trituberculatus]|uniref:Uncharacterized protein n=1 Tax=Portunus trituberculatus TaxID=210409 RepID=A0A5B7J506_PORTR|nr:hypothetical protein [Portunus trituberculatus]
MRGLLLLVLCRTFFSALAWISHWQSFLQSLVTHHFGLILAQRLCLPPLV